MKAEAIHQPCPCGKSSDAATYNVDGSVKCYSCGKFFPSNQGDAVENNNRTFEYLEWRGVNKYVMQKYRVATAIEPNGTPVEIGFRYPNDSYKIRSLTEKKFTAKGPIKDAPLFGIDVFPKGGPACIITEGELDALSAHQMLGIPAFSIKNGAQSAFNDIKNSLDYLNSYDKIFLGFDHDDVGQKALLDVIPLFDPSKCYILKLDTYKDANEYLLKDPERFVLSYKNAKRYTPDNIISSFEDIHKALEEKPKSAISSYPFKKLQAMTYGLREGEVVLLKAPEGVGKTEVIRAIEAHTLETTDLNIGVIHLEENKVRTIKGFASYVLNKACHLIDSFVTNEEVFSAYKQLVRRDDRVHIYSHFGSDDPQIILAAIRYLVVACGCKLIFFDHISIIVSGTEQDDERQKLDYISTQFKMKAEELGYGMVLISHVNDNGQTRGSRNISKIADVVIKLDRELLAEDDRQRNTTYLTVEKNRHAGNTGPAGKALFDLKSYQFKDLG